MTDTTTTTTPDPLDEMDDLLADSRRLLVRRFHGLLADPDQKLNASTLDAARRFITDESERVEMEKAKRFIDQGGSSIDLDNLPFPVPAYKDDEVGLPSTSRIDGSKPITGDDESVGDEPAEGLKGYPTQRVPRAFDTD